jgi:maltooligosyltrehalose trehalohydrolase
MLQMGSNIIKENEVSFRVFACSLQAVSLVVKNEDKTEVYPLDQEEEHIYSTVLKGVGPGSLYKFRLDDGDFPDPYSYFQPEGVHGFSQLIDHSSYQWHDENWKGIDQEKLVIMEIHPGTFSEAGKFQGILEKLDYLQQLGITAIELMPIAQAPGRWNWGYDGVNLFSVNHNYGTPDDLKQLVDTCHQMGIGVILDVVYNHFGPEGNYLSFFGPYLTKKHETPWGEAVNFDDVYSHYIRKYILDNVCCWLDLYHIDGLRLDAVHAIKDNNPLHIIQEISLIANNLSREHNVSKLIIAESDENNTRLIEPLDQGGYGADAQWMDDFHHIIHTSLTGENKGYYMDYGKLKDLEKAYTNYLYTGQYSHYWKRKRGTDASARPGKQFVVSLQNHDQVGNRAQGERLSALIDFPLLKAGAGLVLFSAYIPLIFMGEEYGEENPFLFFTDYQDPELKKAVSLGRKKEFKQFGWGEVPDPQDPETFYRSKLTPQENWKERNHQLFNFYRDLIKLRVSHPVLRRLDKDRLTAKVDSQNRVVQIHRWENDLSLTALFNLGEASFPIDHQGKQIFNSEWEAYGGKETGERESRFLGKGQMVILENQSTP